MSILARSLLTLLLFNAIAALSLTNNQPTNPLSQVVSDVDGTITRSDLLGHVLPTLGVDWSHPGITQLFHNIARNGYQIMFLSSRCGRGGGACCLVRRSVSTKGGWL